MSQIRWIPAKAKLGQSVSVTSASVPLQEHQLPTAVPENKGSFFEKAIYGGLILAGAAAFMTFVFGKKH